MKRTLLLSFALLFAAAAVPAAASEGSSVLRDGGELVRVLKGAYGSLIGDAPAEQAEHVVLVLESHRPGEIPRRDLVPGTEGSEVEQDPTLALDRATDTVWLAWEGRRGVHSGLYLAGLSADGWTDVVELSGNPYSIKSSPQVVATSDVTHQLVGGEVVEERHTVLHLTWWDETAGTHALYTSILIVPGEQPQFFPILNLGEYLGDGEAGLDPPAALHSQLSLRHGTDERSVIVAFNDPTLRRTAAVEVSWLAEDLVQLADHARAQIIIIGRAHPELTRQQLADRARAQVIIVGRRMLSPELNEALAHRVAATVATADPALPLEEVAEAARAELVITGASLSSPGGSLGHRARAQVIIIGRRRHATAASPAPESILLLRVALDRPTPALPARPVEVLSSPDGRAMILAWNTETSVRYRESTPEGWSEIRTLALRPDLSREEAYQALARRVGE